LTAVPRPAEAKNLWAVPNLLLQKLPAQDFTITTLVDSSHLRAGERSGLLVMGRDYSYLAVVKTQTGARIVRVSCFDAPNGTSETEETLAEIRSSSVYIRVSMVGDAICTFSYSTNGKRFQSAGDIFVAKAGIWIGAKVGVFAAGSEPLSGQTTTSGHADYDWFRIAPPARSSRTPARAR
jgi:hypothetical protein